MGGSQIVVPCFIFLVLLSLAPSELSCHSLPVNGFFRRGDAFASLRSSRLSNNAKAQLLAAAAGNGPPHELAFACASKRCIFSFCRFPIASLGRFGASLATRAVAATKTSSPPSERQSVSTTDAASAADITAACKSVPITRLRTACRKLQLCSKGTRDDILKRLQEAPAKQALALLKAPEEASQILENPARAPKVLRDVAAKRKCSKCHVCNSRLSAKARFCSKCGATISVDGQETLREFVENAFWPIREQEVGSNTMRVERGFWQSILQVIGDVPVANLSADVWEEYLRALKKRNCSPRTQVLHQVAYLAALKYAVHTRRLDDVHPFRKIRGCTKRTLVSVPLTAEEVYLLLAATPNTMHCALFAVGIGAGLRPSEILKMRWEDINMEEMTATIRGSKTAASAAVIPLTNLASRELMRWWEEEGRPTSGLCFYAEGIRTPSSRANLEKKTPMRTKVVNVDETVPLRAGIDETRCGEPRRIFPYILRHSFATIAAASNPPVPLPVAQAVMRHTSSKMLLETYAKAGALVIKEGLRNFKI